MSANDWKRELHRLLELFEHESTMSLKVIKRCFDADGLSFDEKFRKYFMKMSTLRLDAGFNTVLFDQFAGNRMPMVPDVGALDENHDDASNVAENEDLIEIKMENSAEDPIEIADTDDEDGDEQRMSTDSNALQGFNIVDVNRDGEGNGFADVNDENGNEVNVKHEVKVETENEMEMVEFDPNKANDDNSVQNDNAEAAMMNNRRQTSLSSNAQKQPKHDAGKRFKCKDCAYTCKYKYHFKQHLQVHTSIKPFKCTHCDYASHRKDDLKRHQKVHVQGKLLGVVRDPNDGLYKCTHCDQQFTEIGYLSKHLTQSHQNNQRLFNCVHCLRRFSQKTEKDKHEIRCENTNDIYAKSTQLQM